MTVPHATRKLLQEALVFCFRDQIMCMESASKSEIIGRSCPVQGICSDGQIRPPSKPLQALKDLNFWWATLTTFENLWFLDEQPWQPVKLYFEWATFTTFKNFDFGWATFTTFKSWVLDEQLLQSLTSFILDEQPLQPLKPLFWDEQPFSTVKAIFWDEQSLQPLKTLFWMSKF